MELVDLIRAAKRVYIIGNGGSYANAEHITNDLLSCGIKAYTINAASFSAFSNDLGYENALAHWIKTVGEEGDLLIALSGSGKSQNILNACSAAQHTVRMTVQRVFGAEQGQDMQTAEEQQLVLGHELRKALWRRA